MRSLLPVLLPALLATFARAEEPAPGTEPTATQPTPTESAPRAGRDERFVIGGMVSFTGDPSELPEGTPVRWVEVEVKLRPTVSPMDYPKEALERGFPGERCSVRLHVDENGIPYDVKPRPCSEISFPTAYSVAMRYRFHPVTIEGKPTRVELDLAINFQPVP